MPFTFSHPAIVLPLKYLCPQKVSLTGLVIGSLTPDFEYFIRMKIQSNYSHTIAGLFWFDLPLGILLAFIFHNIVRNSLVDNLPLAFKSRFYHFKQFQWNTYFKSKWYILLLSVLIGAVSHLLWDSFTHEQSIFINKIHILTNTVGIGDIQIPVFKLLQHGSSIVGLLAIYIVIIKMPRNTNVNSSVTIKYWGLVIGLTFTISLLRMANGFNFLLYGHSIVTVIAALLISLIVAPLLLSIKTKKRL